MSRSNSDNLGVRLLAVVTAICIASGITLGDVDVSVDEEFPAQTFDTIPPDHRSEPPDRRISYPMDSGRPYGPDVESADILSSPASGRPVGGDYCPSTGAQIPASRAVRQLPPGPGGASLFLFGMGCLGAVRIGKSARGLHSMPDWRHTGGPMQVGHATSFDFYHYPPVFCTLVEPPGGRHFRHHLQRDIPPHLNRQFFLNVDAPRGPPAPCS